MRSGWLIERKLSPQAIKEGVIRDCLVRLEGLDHPTRLVVVKAPVHAKRTGKRYVPSSGQWHLLGFADIQDVQRQIDRTGQEQEARAKKRGD